ncbi:unnamed protein product [Darwinula stevensoni]|uniref:SCP domain-containing protein n=1 Tax=Darwinula stevensoni TaxID=69355 RepID=A0A7R9ADM2_9CRUS|nr:unnamed protein product [Darwinula stevensoni]CAG0901449.1 unnamed protein product [Darwinula stevensoni]
MEPCKDPTRWVEASGGEVPIGAVVGGEDGGEALYVARAEHEGDMLPGKLVPSHRVCMQGTPTPLVLVSDDMAKLVWLPGSAGSIPSGALKGGQTASGEPLYIGRCKQGNTLTCGKARIHRSLKACFIPYGGREYGYGSYEVLALKQTPEESAVKPKPEVKTTPKEPEKKDGKICRYSQAWAEQLSQWNRLEHRMNVGRQDGKQYGENCYMAMGVSSVKPEDVVDAWYNEVRYHNYSWNSFVYQTGHFTQVVWTDSKRVGVGIARKGSNWFVVSSYDPPGNYAGRFNRCVRPPVD